jgi:hypothetical protein
LRTNLTMKSTIYYTILLAISILSCPSTLLAQNKKNKQTIVSIEGEKFLINGKPTYKGRKWQGHSIEGLLLNSRMVMGIFDDLNPETVESWKYPDTNKWDPERNTNEFVAAMDQWYSKGLIAFTLNLQGGSPKGYGNKGWINSAIAPNGELRPDYMNRLKKILDRANEKGMVVILGLYYFGQDQNINDEAAIYKSVDNTMDWLFDNKYRNVIIEVANETNFKGYQHKILQPDNIHELIKYIKIKNKNGYRYLVGTSYPGAKIPDEKVVKYSDFILLHGNSINDPAGIAERVNQTKAIKGYKPMPIVFNEDDHYDFDKPSNNFVESVKAYVSWGFFDFRASKGVRGSEIDEQYDDGYQSIPVNWKISSPRKKAFFDKLEEITGGLK